MWVFFKIGLFTFGGGYAMISVISHEVVEKRKYITEEEFSDVVAIAESTPGPIAINSSTYIGYRVGGVAGSILASLSVCLPSFIIIYVISLFFAKFLEIGLVEKAFKGIQCGVAVLIISAAFKLLKNVKKNWISYTLIATSALILLAIDVFSLNISTIYIIVLGMIVGVAAYFRPKRPTAKPTVATDGETEKNADNGVIEGLSDEIGADPVKKEGEDK
ncbi:MAG: chromate transporter [Clostridia bacterium]|nr:chromate transporter [Clostridia bacterium]